MDNDAFISLIYRRKNDRKREREKLSFRNKN